MAASNADFVHDAAWTALLFMDRCNDLLVEGGKLWPMVFPAPEVARLFLAPCIGMVSGLPVTLRAATSRLDMPTIADPITFFGHLFAR